MSEQEVIVTTKHGGMPSFFATPNAPGEYPAVIIYMDAPGIREELRNFARRIAANGYCCLLADVYYRLGTLRFDVPRLDVVNRRDPSTQPIRAANRSYSNEMVTDDTAAMLTFLDAQDKVKPGRMGCVGFCMSGRCVATAAYKFSHRFGGCASLFGVGIVTEETDSPHLFLDRVEAEMYFGFAEFERGIPDHVIPDLKAAMAKAGTRGIVEVHPGAHHGFCFPERDVYHAEAAENAWGRIFAMWERNLR